MFGNKPKHENLTGQPAESEDGKLYGRYAKLIEVELDALERKLTKQILCKHESYIVLEVSGEPLHRLQLRQMGRGYEKICNDCGINLGDCGYEEKEKQEYEIAKQKVEQFEESQLKEPEELPSDATEYRGNFSHIRKSHRINKAKYILQDALDEKERIDSEQSNRTRTDCHNILFKAVEQALLELSKD